LQAGQAPNEVTGLFAKLLVRAGAVDRISSNAASKTCGIEVSRNSSTPPTYFNDAVVICSTFSDWFYQTAMGTMFSLASIHVKLQKAVCTVPIGYDQSVEVRAFSRNLITASSCGRHR
jgi:hypothetical protein